MSIAKRLHQEVIEERRTIESAERILQKLYGQKKHEQQEFQFSCRQKD